MEVISSSAVICLDLPAEAYDKVVAGFTPEALAKKGITNVKKGRLARSDSYLYLIGEQKHPRADFEKFILVLRDARTTAVVTFNVPKGSLAEISIKREDVIKALTTAKLEAQAAPSLELFTLGYLGPYEVSGQISGASRVYTVKGDTGPKNARNVIAVSPSIHRLPVESVQELSRFALDGLRNVRDLAVRESRDVRIDNLAGHHIMATAKHGASGAPMVIRQLILLPANGGYFRLLSMTRTADDARLAPEIEKIFASFKAKDLGTVR